VQNVYAAANTILRDTLPGSEPAEVIEEIVLNPEPDLDAVPVEVEQVIMARIVMQYGDWKGIDEEEMRRGREVEAELGGNAAIFGNHQGSDQNPASFMGGLNILNIQLFQNHCNAMKLVELRTGSLDYKTIWLMLYLSSLSMSFIFRALILSIPVTWISHLYYGYWFYYIFFKGGVTIPPLVLVRHLGRLSQIYLELTQVSQPCSKLLARHLLLWLDCVLSLIEIASGESSAALILCIYLFNFH